MNPLQIKLAAAEKDIERLKKENSSLSADLAHVIEQLGRARKARFPKLSPRAGGISRHVDGNISMFGMDVHGAKMNKPAVGSFLSDVTALQPDNIYLLGDVVDCGGFLAQHHTLGYVAETEYTYEDDIRAGNSFLDALRAAAPNAKIEYVEGNHEQRVERWAVTFALRHRRDAEGLLRRNGPEFLLRCEERGIRYYRMSQCYDGLTVPGTIKRGNSFYTHGSFLKSRNAARDAVAKFSGNVVFGNTHRSDAYIGRRPNVGIVGGWNPGCLCELQPLWMNTDPTDWTHGYGIRFSSKDGKFIHLNVPIIDGNSMFLNAIHESSIKTSRQA